MGEVVVGVMLIAMTAYTEICKDSQARRVPGMKSL